MGSSHKKTLLLFPDQLTLSLIPPDVSEIIMPEIIEDWLGHHKQKVVFFLTSMRNFAAELHNLGYKVTYYDLKEKITSWELFLTNLKRENLVIIMPSDKRWRQVIKAYPDKIEILEDTRFFCGEEEFTTWIRGKKEVRLEFFYRYLRKKHKILLQNDGKPEGGSWNYDKENRKAFTKNLQIPPRIARAPEPELEQVMQLVAEIFPNNFGSLVNFNLATTRKGALQDLYYFLENFLVNFGPYQDMMMTDEPYLFHSNLSSYLNIGLLTGSEVVHLVEEQYKKGLAPLASVEGFIRQILGWREFIRGLYYNNSYEGNFFNAKNKLPDLYWSGKTNLFCLNQVVKITQEYSYSHHIQRLMITGNFALIAGIIPSEAADWYLKVYSDALEWVELPNTFSMALFADGGILASKPYAASANYINKMSNFCTNCFYNPTQLLGEKACPFNSLYWNFFIKHRALLEGNPRLIFVFKYLNNLSPEKINTIQNQANTYLSKLENNLL
jgi:deoxyribodipyrimidine photolyase-related protein